MNVGILGSGDVAKALAAGFLKHGHDVMLGTRDTGQTRRLGEKQSEGAHRQLCRNGPVRRVGGARGQGHGGRGRVASGRCSRTSPARP